MNCVGHQSQGLWRHPRDRSPEYKHTRHWVDLACLLERGKFDGLFLDDVVGVYSMCSGLKKEYRRGTYREKLVGRGPRLEDNHPGATPAPKGSQVAASSPGGGSGCRLLPALHSIG